MWKRGNCSSPPAPRPAVATGLRAVSRAHLSPAPPAYSAMMAHRDHHPSLTAWLPPPSTRGIGLGLGRRRGTPGSPTRGGRLAADRGIDPDGGREEIRPATDYNAIMSIIALNLVSYGVDHYLTSLNPFYLHHGSQFHAYQLVTSLFCHASWSHLSSNLFFLLVFGRLIEEDSGGPFVWFTYLACGVGGALFALWFTPAGRYAATVTLGASGAVFGLFVVAVLLKLEPNWKKMLEVVVFGNFVLTRMFEEVKTSIAGGLPGVSHVAHIGGAVAGLVLVFAIAALVNAAEEKEKRESQIERRKGR